MLANKIEKVTVTSILFFTMLAWTARLHTDHAGSYQVYDGTWEFFNFGWISSTVSTVREAHMLPTVGKKPTQLDSTTVFLDLDAESRFHHLLLEEYSHSRTSFATRYRLYIFKHVPFGMARCSRGIPMCSH